jgi:hypothetical protein
MLGFVCLSLTKIVGCLSAFVRKPTSSRVGLRRKVCRKKVSSITNKSSDSNTLNSLKKKLSHSISNSLSLNSFHHQFLESTPLGLRHLLRERNFSSGWRLWCNGARQSRRRKPRPRRQWCFEKPVGEHGSFGFAVRALVRPGSDP